MALTNTDKKEIERIARKEIKDFLDKPMFVKEVAAIVQKELKTNNKDSIEDLVENLNEKTKNFAQKLIDKNFENFVGKDLDVLE